MKYSYDASKYRFGLSPSGRGTTTYTRAESIKAIAEFLALNRTPCIKKFDGKNVSEEHAKALIESAKLWNKLDTFEADVRKRSRVKKREHFN